MNLEQVKNIISNMEQRMNQLDKSMSNLVSYEENGLLYFSTKEDQVKYSYISGQIDLLKQISQSVLKYTIEDDFDYYKDIYGDFHIDFMKGFMDSFMGLDKYIKI